MHALPLKKYGSALTNAFFQEPVELRVRTTSTIKRKESHILEVFFPVPYHQQAANDHHAKFQTKLHGKSEFTLQKSAKHL